MISCKPPCFFSLSPQRGVGWGEGWEVLKVPSINGLNPTICKSPRMCYLLSSGGRSGSRGLSCLIVPFCAMRMRLWRVSYFLHRLSY